MRIPLIRPLITFFQKAFGFLRAPSPLPIKECAHCGYRYQQIYIHSYVYCDHCQKRYLQENFRPKKHPNRATRYYFSLCKICRKKNPTFLGIQLECNKDKSFSGVHFLWQDKKGNKYELYTLSDYDNGQH